MPIKLGSADVSFRLGAVEVDAAYLGAVSVYSGLHPEAKDWEAAVMANGGTVSATTLTAVSDFCKSIDAAGIRDRFYRLNLFAGTGLNAALVPLYRGQSRTGTQLGNTTDTNNGPFVSGDFSESSGLKGDGTSKSLDTGLAQNAAGSLSSLHASVSFTELEASGDRAPISNNGFSVNNFVSLQAQASYLAYVASFDTASGTRTTAESHLMMSRSSNSLLTLYSGGSSVGTQTATVSPGTASTTWRVFVRQDSVNAVNRTAMRLRLYSIGSAIDGAAATAFANAVAALNTALGR